VSAKALAAPVDPASQWKALLLIGLATGIFSGTLGIGGAAILIPGMVGVLALSQHKAHGTSLMIIVPTAALSAIVYALRGQVDWGLVIVYSASSAVGAVVGASLMPRVPARDLKRLFGIFVLLVAVRMLVPAPVGTLTSLDLTDPSKLFGSLGLGLFAGLCSGLLGIGGGQILVPGMVILFGVSQRLAQGVSLAFIVPTALFGTITHYQNGNAVPRIAAFIVPSALVGGLIGSNISQIVDVHDLKVFFGLFLLYAGCRMVLGNLVVRWRRSREKDPARADAPASG
jgi:uncharacterized membrane protein YfcA